MASAEHPHAREGLVGRIGAAEASLHAIAMRWLDPMPMPTELTLRQVQVLVLVRAHPGLTGQELADLLGVSTPTTSGLIDRIVTRGWLDRQPDPADRRRMLLRITAGGEQVLAALEEPAMQAKSQVLSGLSTDELTDLARLMERMRDVAAQIEADRSAR